MNEEMQRIRELQDEMDVRQREQLQELRRDVLANAERSAATTLAARTAMFGSVPSMLWCVFTSVRSDWMGLIPLVYGSICFVFPFLTIAALAGAAAGLFADWCFAQSAVPVRRAAITMALLMDAVMLGWVIVLFR